jgi:type I restriction enzyme M protein
MIDARHMFRKVNRTLNDFSELQQLKLISIVHLYRGQDTLSEADVRLRFPVGADSIRSEADQDKLWQDYLAWLDGHFPERTFVDQEGLCKRVSLADIRENDYSLNPGRYVGVSLEVEEDFDFEGRMREIKKELEKLQIEGKQLSQEINTHLGNLLS